MVLHCSFLVGSGEGGGGVQQVSDRDYPML